MDNVSVLFMRFIPEIEDEETFDKMTSFRSLYEIPGYYCIRSTGSHGTLFPFSLWDSEFQIGYFHLNLSLDNSLYKMLLVATSIQLQYLKRNQFKEKSSFFQWIKIWT